MKPSATAACAYALGTTAAACSLGVFVVTDEKSAFVALHPERARSLLPLFAAILLGEAVVWGGVVRATTVLRRRWAIAVAGAALCLATLLALCAVVILGLDHTWPSMFPKVGAAVAVFADAALMLSFVPVLRLARRAEAMGACCTPGELSLAATSWFSTVAAIALVVAPRPYFFVGCSVVLALAVLWTWRVCAHGSGGRTALLQGFRVGGLRVVIAGAFIALLRLSEQSLTRNPAVIAIYSGGLAGRCSVEAAGQQGATSLWIVNCGGWTSAPIRWDERSGRILNDR